MPRTLSTPEYRRLCCPACKAPRADCYCASIQQTSSPLKLIIVQHARERFSQSNTGNLVRRVLPGAELLDFGGQGTGFDASTILAEDLDPVLLFPLADRPVISPDDLTTTRGRKPALVVLDATWRQARRMLTRIPGLGGLRIRRLPEEASPTWRLRQPTGPGQLSTADAVAWAFRCLGLPETAQAVLDALSRVASYVLAVRGQEVLPPGISTEPTGTDR